MKREAKIGRGDDSGHRDRDEMPSTVGTMDARR